jgi:hypothetical protein
MIVSVLAMWSENAMDPTNPDTWKQQWAAFWSAPWVMAPLILVVGSIVWWFRGTMFEREIASLKEQIAAWDQRLKLATDLVAASDRAKDELDKQFQAYKADVAFKGSNASPAKVDAAFEQLRRENTILEAGLKATHQSLPLGTGYGALKKNEGLGNIGNIGNIGVGKTKHNIEMLNSSHDDIRNGD